MVGNFAITPAAPSSNDMVRFSYGSAGCGGHVSHVLVGNTITIRDEIDCLCWATAPPYFVEFEMGPFPAGDYSVEYEQYVTSVVNACGAPQLNSSLTHSLVVSSTQGLPSSSIPAAGALSQGVLVAAVLVVALLHLARRAATGSSG